MPRVGGAGAGEWGVEFLFSVLAAVPSLWYLYVYGLLVADLRVMRAFALDVNIILVGVML